MKNGPARAFDLVVWGATGFTGQLVAEYLVRRNSARPGLRWALGGRSREKLEALRHRLAAIAPEAAALPLVVADAKDSHSLDAFVPNARAIASTVGPFSLYGRELVAACARHGTHYVDLAGEVPFVRQMIDAHHDEAVQSGAKIVPCCGFDSVPSDLGVFMLQQEMKALHGRPCSEVHTFAGESRGGISGGTIASGLLLLEEMGRDREVRRLLADPYALDPGHGPASDDEKDFQGVRFDPRLGRWTGPFVMAGINARVVRRSNALQGYAYGRDFKYTEVMSFPAGLKGAVAASAVATGVAAFFGLGATRPGRAVLRRVLPSPGQGPSLRTRERGYFVFRLVGEGTDAQGAKVRLRGEVRGTSDPGYGETAKMISEAAICLVEDDAQLPATGGVLTPAAAMGISLIERLRTAGMTFSVQPGESRRKIEADAMPAP